MIGEPVLTAFKDLLDKMWKAERPEAFTDDEWGTIIELYGYGLLLLKELNAQEAADINKSTVPTETK